MTRKTASKAPSPTKSPKTPRTKKAPKASKTPTCPACAEREMFWKEMREGAKIVIPTLLSFVPSILAGFTQETQDQSTVRLLRDLVADLDKKQTEDIYKMFKPSQLPTLMELINRATQT